METWFYGNAETIYFAYGLVFFSMGGAVALTALHFRNSKLALGAGLPYLAGFGLLLGIGEWGVVFIPLQAPYLSQVGLALLAVLQTSLVALAYACLLAFGLALNLTQRRVAALALFSALVWPLFFVVSGQTLDLGPGFDLWRKSAHFIAAWGLGLPGALLAARGILRQRQEIALAYPKTSRWLLLAAATFVLSVPVGTLAIPSSPMNIAGQLIVQTIGGIPVQAMLGAGGLVLTWSLLTGLEIFRLESSQRVEEAERRQSALEERHRIGKELKDGTIQELFAASLLVETAVAQLPASEETAGAVRVLAAVSAQLRESTARLRSYVMDLEPIDWETPDLAMGIQRLADDFHANTLVPVQISVPEGSQAPPEIAREVYRVAYETLAQIRRRAGAVRVGLSVEWQGSTLALKIAEYGTGAKPEVFSWQWHRPRS